ncbi:MAG: DEAD/DEAH box helicase [Sedimentisphaerales bacterium]
MGIQARFIGINKHLDTQIRDLIGARRDATALWALFCDSIPRIKAELIVDEEASTKKLRRALSETLEQATPDDTVILSFAGHGTNDHRLVMYDTIKEELDDTTISMEEIATLFKKSKARAVLLILDCCFSGGAPARIFEDSPISRRSDMPLDELAGKGRIIITASNVNEPAWEHPKTRHGLLTKALIEVLQNGSNSIDLTTAMNEVMNRVRADAGRIGKSQTPVLLGFIEGGLAIPVLKPGEVFYTHFPELKGINISSNIEDLAKFGLPEPVLYTWSNLFRNGLNKLQLQAVNEYRIFEGKSLLVVAPTTSGKTFIGEMAGMRAISEGRKTIFLLPYRALVNEKYDQFTSIYGDQLDMRVLRCSGDYTDQADSFVRGKYDIAFLTFEMFLNISVNSPSLLNHIGLIVIDEAQFITDPHRGIVVELLLTYLLAARNKEIAPQIIALSAVIGDVNDFDTWLDCKKLITYERPVPLIEGVLDRNGTFQYLDESGKVKETQLLPFGSVFQRRSKPSSQDVIVPLVKDLLLKNNKEKIIIFRNMKGSAEGAANYLAQELGLPAAKKAIDSLPSHDLPTTSEKLRNCLQGGTAFHNTNLLREEKVVVERQFRDPDGPVKVLSATTTLAAGVNTPATTVILAEQQFVGEDGRPFTVAEYKNMSGRAGRLGFNEKGLSIILAQNSNERNVLFKRYITGKLERIRSSFDPSHIETWIIRLLVQVKHIPKKEVVTLLLNTYGGYLANKENPKWLGEITLRLEQLLKRMIGLGLVDQEDENVQLTLLGSICGQSLLSFNSAMRFVELLKLISPSQITPACLMALVQALDELDNNIYTPLMKRGYKESVRQQEATDRYGPDVVRILQRHVQGDQFIYFARCKRAAILWDWINGIPVKAIQRQYSTNPFQGTIDYGSIRTFADFTRFILRSAYQIADLILLGQGPTGDQIEILLKQLEVGIPADAIELLSIPLPLDRGQYLALHNLGVKDVKDLRSLSDVTIRDILGDPLTEQLKKLNPHN